MTRQLSSDDLARLAELSWDDVAAMSDRDLMVHLSFRIAALESEMREFRAVAESLRDGAGEMMKKAMEKVQTNPLLRGMFGS